MFFSGSPKRQSKLKSVIEAYPESLSDSAKTKLVDLCRTRWVARHSALVTFGDLYPAVVDALDDISSDNSWNADSTSKASSLLRSVTDFNFIATFSIVSNIMAYIHSITIQLQGETQDVCKAYREVQAVTEVVGKARWCGRDATNMADKVRSGGVWF